MAIQIIPFDKKLKKDTINNDSIVILTRCARPKNLSTVCRSVLELYQSMMDNYDKILAITHIIIFDKYKCSKEDVEAAKNDVRNVYSDLFLGFNYIFEYRGLKKDNEYGAKMLIDSVDNLMSRYYTHFNPWLYILDDDNIIHPSFVTLLKEHIGSEKILIFGQKRSMQRFDRSYYTEICILTKNTMFIDSNGNRTNDIESLNAISVNTHPDSAQFLVRYDTLMKAGNYANSYLVDFDTVWKLYEMFEDDFEFIEYVASYYNYIDSELIQN